MFKLLNFALKIFKIPDDTSCIPTTRPPTFLFAYSNDLSSDTVSDTWAKCLYLQYSWYGSVRFDTENINIELHTNYNDTTSTIQNNLPDPNLGFQDSSIGSNVFDAIEIINSFPIFLTPYPVYATTLQVTGSGTKTLPDFHSPITDDYWIAITFQDHVPIDSFHDFNLRWTNPGDSGNFDSYTAPTAKNGGTYACGWNNFDATNYSMTLDYNYLGQDVQNLQIRIYSQIPLNNWLPYSD